MKQQDTTPKFSIRLLCAALAVLLVASAVVLAVVFSAEKEPQVVVDPATEAALLEAQASIAELEAEAASYKSQISSYQSLVSTYEERIAQLTDSAATDTAVVEELQTQIDSLNARIIVLREENTKTNSKIKELQKKIKGYDAKAVAEMESNVAAINKFIKVLTEDVPLRTVTEDVTFDVTDPKTGAVTQQTTKVTYQKPAAVSVYYEDLTTGYVFSFGADKARYAASLIKAPYMYCVLKDISAFQSNKLHYDANGAPLYDDDGNPLFTGRHPNLNEDGTLIYLPGEEKYDLSRVWTFDKETMSVEGSGSIKNEETGFQLTYRQLIEYAILYSDNIALNEIKKEFGTSIYNTEAKVLGVKGYKNGFMQLSAADCGIWLRTIQSFIDNDASYIDETMTYGAFLKDIMSRAGFSYLIGSGVSPTPIAHKYGWDVDAFHDMAIVYDEHPYVLVIMTDLDEGTAAEGNAAVKYIVSVAKSMNKYHKELWTLPEETEK